MSETEVYKYITLDNGDILLKKITIKDSKYKITIKPNGDKLLKKINKNKPDDEDILFEDINNIIESNNIDTKIDTKIDSNDTENDTKQDIDKKKQVKTIMNYVSKFIENGSKILSDGSNILIKTQTNIRTLKLIFEGVKKFYTK